MVVYLTIALYDTAKSLHSQAHTLAFSLQFPMRSSPLLCIALSLAAREAIRMAIPNQSALHLRNYNKTNALQTPCICYANPQRSAMPLPPPVLAVRPSERTAYALHSFFWNVEWLGQLLGW